MEIQDKCYNIVSFENGVIVSPLDTITICSFECNSNEIVNKLKKDISKALSNTTFERFGKAYIKPISVYIAKKVIYINYILIQQKLMK